MYIAQSRTPITGAMDYCRSLADALPGPVVLSRGNYHADPLVKALFASPEELEEVIRISPETIRLREQGQHGEMVAMMTMLKQEKTVFGYQQEGEIIRRDVAQRAVSFYDHRIVAPSPELEQTRDGIVRRGLEVLATVAMEGITTLRSRKSELGEKREYLKGILKIMGGKSNVLEIFAAPDPEHLEQYLKAERALAEVERELGGSAGADGHPGACPRSSARDHARGRQCPGGAGPVLPPELDGCCGSRTSRGRTSASTP